MGALHFVPNRPGHLRGREAQLAELARLMEASDAAITPALSGQGGIGKTQLAALFAHDHADRFSNGVFWLSMADAGTNPNAVADRIASFAREVDLMPGEQGSAERVNRDLAERWLGKFGGSRDTLLVLDNLEDSALLRRPLPSLPNHPFGQLGCRKLVTSRQPDLPGCRAMRLDFLRPPADREVLLEAAGREMADAAEDAALRELLTLLGGLPLALRLAGSLLKTPNVRAERLLGLLRKDGARAVLDARGAPLADYRDGLRASLGAVLAETWSALPSDRPELAEAVEALATLPHGRSWPAGLLRILVRVPDDPLLDDPLPALLGELEGRNVMERPTDSTVRLHPLIWEFVRERHQGAGVRVAAQAERGLADAGVLGGLDEADWRLVHEVLGVVGGFSGLEQQRPTMVPQMRRTIAPSLDVIDDWNKDQIIENLAIESGRRGHHALSAVLTEVVQNKTGTRLLRRWSAERTTDPAELHVLAGHRGAVPACAFAPDGRLALSASADGTLRLWDVATGSCRAVLEGHTHWVTACAFAPDGRLALSASGDGTLRLWDVAAGSCRAVLEGHTNWVTACAFAPDGRLALSASEDRTLRLWDVAAGSCRAVLKGHTHPVTACAFAPDGRLALSASEDKTLRLWYVAAGSCRAVLEGHTRWVRACAFAPDGRLALSASNDGTLRLWDVAAGSCRAVLEGHTNWVTACAFAPDGRLALSASDDGTLRMWDVAAGSCRAVLEGHTRWVRACAFAPDGRLALSASNGGTLRLWDVAAGSCRAVLEGHTTSVAACAFAPDGRLALSASNDGTLRLWDVAAGSCRHVVRIGGRGLAVSASNAPNRNLVLTGDTRGGLHCLELVTP